MPPAVRKPAASARGLISAFLIALAAGACGNDRPVDRVRVSGHVEADDVQLAPEVGGRILELNAAEGDRIEAGTVVARLDARDTELALQQARADRAAAQAQLDLLLAGSRPEDIAHARAQRTAAEAEVAAAKAELASAEADLERFEALLEAKAGSRKARDDARTRRDVARQRLQAAEEQARALAAQAERVEAGPRRQEIAAARARVAAADARIATLEKALADAVVKAPVSGVVSEKLVNVGELVAPRTPLVVLTDLEHAWAEVFVDEPLTPRLRIGQEATVYTDAGGEGIKGRVTFISPRAEFTPRNVQTAEERSRLVYRVKVSVDNSAGILKPGMPVEAEIPLGEAGAQAGAP